MIKQLKTSLGVAAGLAALSLGGAAIAGAAAGTAHPTVKPAKHAKREATQTRDTDQVQSGDQTTPDTGSTTSRKTSAESAPETSSRETSSESAPETSSETSGETTVGNDGPGGHADEPGNPNADTHQLGQN